MNWKVLPRRVTLFLILSALILTYFNGVTFNAEALPLNLSEEGVKIELNQVVKEISLDPWGNLIVSDFYLITNKGNSVYSVSLYVPVNATEVLAQDVYGPVDAPVQGIEDAYKKVSVVLRDTLEMNGTTKLTLSYRLPFKAYIKQNSFEDYTLTLNFLNFINYAARKVTIEVILPEGAELQSSTKNVTGINQGKIIFDYVNVTGSQDLNVDLNYRYGVFWASFRPVSWVGILAAVFSTLLFLRGSVKPAVVVTPIPLEKLRRFVDAYEEKMRVRLELESMERQIKSGKLSKRQHRVRRSSLHNRFLRLQKELTSLQPEIEAAGGRYADMMRQIEVAEAELETLRDDIQRVEARYHRKELSAEAHRRLLDEYNRRRERAENTISRVILRLREEVH